MYRSDLLTVFANLAGIPAVTIPWGLDKGSGMPIGLQIMGRRGEDSKVLALADSLQKFTNWHNKVKELKL